MMGHRQVEQAALFHEFSLERHVPTDHLLRSIDRFVELGEIRRESWPASTAHWGAAESRHRRRPAACPPGADFVTEVVGDAAEQ
jgi:hypothetical protein